MSKSKGNIFPLKDLIKQHGADLVRINITASNENMDDADWKEDSLKTFSSRLSSIEQLVNNLKKSARNSVNNLDKYMETVLQNSIEGAPENYEIMKFRSGIPQSSSAPNPWQFAFSILTVRASITAHTVRLPAGLPTAL